ncbi:MAG: hypothetical protein FWC10_10690 [Lentimicrobiaceae bacterium]|nr:hypothetical protein [Lentimicrobiaceae bacterium]
MRRLVKNKGIITEKARDRKWHATACNKHIAKIAALPPLENMYEIASLPPAGKCSVAATSPICRTLAVMRGRKRGGQ